MFTKFDKALVTLVMSGVAVVNLLGFHFGIDEGTVTAIVAVITPVLAYLVPNLPQD